MCYPLRLDLTSDTGVMTTSNIHTIIEPFCTLEGGLLPALHAVQHALGYIPPEASETIASAFRVSKADVDGTVSFYAHFRSAPAGRHVVEVCRAEACQAMGGRDLEEYAKASLGVDWGDTTADGSVTLEPVYCLGNCACTPSIAVDGKVYAKVDERKFDRIIGSLKGQEASI